MLIDEVTLTLEAGNGGNGAVAFQKVRLMQGPTGADGGRGGSIYFEGVSDIGALQTFASRKSIRAESGKNGRGQFIDGRAGEDMTLRVPTGTTIRNLNTGAEAEITKSGERLLAVQGGVGGRGNFKFRSAINTTPMKAEAGTAGESAAFELKLRLIADVGLIGLPNAGKSSLLNELTAARSKVGNYAFTTLEPNLGAYFGLVIADIPGLIEGASEGKGLGTKFLKHIERTKTLFHLVSAESDDVVRDYKTVRTELRRYSETLTDKKELIFLTKSDAVSPQQIEEKISALNRAGVAAVPISIVDAESLAAVVRSLNEIRDAA